MSFRKAGTGLAATCMFLVACQHAAGPKPETSAPQATVLEKFEVISLQRSACFGSCPVYSVSIDAQGKVRYQGERHVAQKGVHHGSADRDELLALWQTLEEHDFFRMPSYLPGKEGCGTVATDMATLVLSVQREGRTHSVRYYRGCTAAPEGLDEIARLIDQAAGSSRWIKNSESTVQ